MNVLAGLHCSDTNLRSSFNCLNDVVCVMQVKGQEDLATYSTIKPKMEMEVDINPSSLYCRVSKPK